MAKKLIYQDLPSPQEDNFPTVLTALRATIQNCQALTGELFKKNKLPPEGLGGPAASGAPSRTFCFRKLNADEPDPEGYLDGDQWLQPPLAPTETWITKIWFRGRWVDYP